MVHGESFRDSLKRYDRETLAVISIGFLSYFGVISLLVYTSLHDQHNSQNSTPVIQADQQKKLEVLSLDIDTSNGKGFQKIMY